MRIGPDEMSSEPLAVGIDQQLVGIEAMAGVGLVGPVHAIAVELTGPDVGEIDVPHVLAALGHRYAPLLAPPGAVEQAELDLSGVRREQRKGGAAAVPGGAERIGCAGSYLPVAKPQERERRQQGVERQDEAPDYHASQRWKRRPRSQRCRRRRSPHRN